MQLALLSRRNFPTDGQRFGCDASNRETPLKDSVFLTGLKEQMNRMQRVVDEYGQGCVNKTEARENCEAKVDKASFVLKFSRLLIRNDVF